MTTAASDYESRGVVVANGLGIAKRLQNGIGLEDLEFQCSQLVHFILFGGNRRQVLDDLFGVFRLAGARFARDKDGLVFAIFHHCVVRGVSHGKNVWRNFIALLVLVHLHNGIVVDWEAAVRIDCDQEEARVRLKEESQLIDLNRNPKKESTIAPKTRRQDDLRK